MSTVSTSGGRQPGGVGSDTAVRAKVSPEKSARLGAWYVAEHRIRGMRNYGWTMVIGAVGTPLLYLFAFGLGLATIVDRTTGDIDGVGFLQFVAPALLATSALMIAAEELTFTIVSGFQWNPVFVAMNAAPLTARQIAGGVLISTGTRMLATVGVYLAVIAAFGGVLSWWAILTVPIAMLCALAVGGFLMAYSASLDPERGQLNFVMRFGITPLMLFSGTFFPITQLPIWLQWIGWISPLWHASEAGRILSYGDPIGADGLMLLLLHIGYPLVLAIAGYLVAVRVMARRLNK